MFSYFWKCKRKIKDLEPADAIFVGGTGGDTADIVQLCQRQTKDWRKNCYWNNID